MRLNAIRQIFMMQIHGKKALIDEGKVDFVINFVLRIDKFYDTY